MKKRLFYLFLSFSIIAIALFLRKQWAILPFWINIWLGDFLWGMMLFFLFLSAFPNANRKKTTIGLIVFCWLIETSQLLHTTWLDAFRATTFGGLLLGHGFLWSDILSYTIGVFAAYWINEKL